MMATNSEGQQIDKRRIILDAAVKVFAQKGFHGCRVSDIAKEADVAYGLVYHYFESKDEMLNTLFSERWGVLLDHISEIDEHDIPAREKLYEVASFIIDSYWHDPDLMKVIIVEVTRAANSFGRAHLNEIEDAYRGIEAIVAGAQKQGTFKKTIPAEFASMVFYGAIEQLLSGWIFDILPKGEKEFEHAKERVVEAVCGGLEVGESVRVSGAGGSAGRK